MGKKAAARKDAPPPLLSRDHFERAHFAVQASVYLQQLVPGPSAKRATLEHDGVAESEQASSSAIHVEKKVHTDRKGKRRADPPYSLLARSIGSVKGWTEHNQVKLDPSLKRIICKACATVLVPGLTSQVRIRPNETHGNKVHHTCLSCRAILSIPAPPSGVPEDGVDGPVRARRRERRRRCVPFHERERDDSESGNGKSTPSGHVLWRGNEKVHRWGMLEPTESTLPRGKKSAAKQPAPESTAPKPAHTPASAPAPTLAFEMDEEEAANNM